VRPIVIIGRAGVALAFVGMLTWTRLAPAQVSTSPKESKAETFTITVLEVEVRSGPSTSYYATGKLTNGQTVEVVGDAPVPGWLRIKPPPHTQSWINTRFVAIKGNSGTVLGDPNVDVPVKAGSSAPNQEPNVEIAKVKAGTQAVVLGEPKIYSDGAWLLIEPTYNEVRYIPESAVTKSADLLKISRTAQMPGLTEQHAGYPSPITQADAKLAEYKALLLQAAKSTDPAIQAQANCRLEGLRQLAATVCLTQRPGHPFSTVAQSCHTPKVVLGTTAEAEETADIGVPPLRLGRKTVGAGGVPGGGKLTSRCPLRLARKGRLAQPVGVRGPRSRRPLTNCRTAGHCISSSTGTALRWNTPLRLPV
jgi:uncharacterized protein YraI